MRKSNAIKIYRYGRYVATVDSEEQLHRWILANVPYEKNECCIPEGFTLKTCKEIAREKAYSFMEDKEMDINHDALTRLHNILNYATFPEVAADLSPITKKGMHYIGICPHCHEKAMVISPKHQIYKCFGCGKTGNVINYVMAERKLEDADALNYLESKYCNN